MRSRLIFLELRTRALDERIGAILFPLVVPCNPRINWSTRIPWGLYEVQLRVRSPSKWFTVFFQFACTGRWHPAQEVVQERWQVKHSMRSSEWANVLAWPGTLPQVLPSFCIVLARRAFSL